MTSSRRPGLARRLANFVWRGAARRLDGRAEAWLSPWLDRSRGRDTGSPTAVAKVTVLASTISGGREPADPDFPAHVTVYVDELVSRLLAGNGPHDARNVKRLRTALRRLRALVRETAPHDSAAVHERGMRRAGKRLGAVRDLDVLIAGVAARRASSGSELECAALDELEGRLARDRESAIARAQRRLDTDALRDVVLGARGYASQLRSGEAIAQAWWTATRDELFAALAGAPASDDDLDALHRVRIAARRGRYGVECFGPIAPADALLWTDDALALQRSIGSHRDAALLHEHLRAEIERATRCGRITLARGLEASAVAARSDRARTFLAAQRLVAAARARARTEQPLGPPQLRGSEAARSPTRNPPGRSGLA